MKLIPKYFGFETKSEKESQKDSESTELNLI